MPPHLLNSPFVSFSSMWDYVPVKFKCGGDVALCGASDTIARHRLRGLRVHRIFIKRTWLIRSIDFISEIERSRLIGYSINFGGDTWTHLDATMEIGWRKWRDHEIVAHDHRAIMAVDQSLSDQTARIFRAEIPYKYRCSSL